MEPLKRCPKCGIDKAFTNFSRNRCEKDGLQVYCKDCVAGVSAYYYRRRREALGKTVRERVEVPADHKFCPGCREISPLSNWHRNASARDGYAAYCKNCRKVQGEEQHLRRTFGITIDERDSLFAEQDGLCAICRSAPIKHLDHCHETNEIRGGLCGPCNMGLGQFADDPQRLIAAARYLIRHGAQKRGSAAVIDIGYWTRPSPLEVNLRRHLAS